MLACACSSGEEEPESSALNSTTGTVSENENGISTPISSEGTLESSRPAEKSEPESKEEPPLQENPYPDQLATFSTITTNEATANYNMSKMCIRDSAGSILSCRLRQWARLLR